MMVSVRIRVFVVLGPKVDHNANVQLVTMANNVNPTLARLTA